MSIQFTQSVPQTPNARFLSILQLLVENGVEFVLVGGVAGVLHGAPVNTFDVAIVHRRTPENISRLLHSLDLLEARYRHSSDRNLRPGESHLLSPGHQLLMTRFGPLDVLGMIGNNHDYDELIGKAVPMELGSGLTMNVVSLPMLIQTKEEVGQSKDQVSLEILRETLRSKDKG